MLEYLKLTNFQKHKSLEVDLDPYITVLSGDTESGKSTILRALEWLALNDPPVKTDSFITHGKSFAEVEAIIDGHQVIRSKGKSENAYWLDGKVQEAFGAYKVPDDIARLLNLDEVNFQSQHDSPFWFMETPGQLSKELNSIVNLEIMDTTLAHAASRTKRLKANLELCKGRLKSAKEQKEDLAWVPDMDRDLKAAEDIHQQLEDTCHTLAGLDSRLQNAQTALDACDMALGATTAAAKALEIGQQLIPLGSKRRDLDALLYDVDQLANLKVVSPDLTELNRLVKAMDGHQKSMDKISDLITSYQNAEDAVWRVNDLAQKAWKNLEKMTGNKCPICQRPL